MKPGTPGFIGLRLAQAREVLGMSQAELARLLGVQRQAVSAYESVSPEQPNIGATPAPEVLFKMLTTFELPVEFFMKPVQLNALLGPLLRQKKSTTARRRTRGLVLAEWACEIVAIIEKYVSLPTVKLPVLIQEVDSNKITQAIIREKAEELRRVWGLEFDQPITNLMKWLESNGVVVVSFDFQADGIDGFTLEFEGRPFIFLNSRIRTPSRQLLTLAHEIAHIILHSRIARNPTSLEYDPVLENQAFALARWFLLPEKAFLRDVYQLRTINLDNLKVLKMKWRVSIAAMVEYLSSLGVITLEQRTALYKNIARRDWRFQEPFDESMSFERPSVISKALSAIASSSHYQVRNVIMEAAFESSQVKEIFGVDLDDLEPQAEAVKTNEHSILKFYDSKDQSLF